MLRKIFAVILVLSAGIMAQSMFRIETDKHQYSYRESIDVCVKLINNTDTSFSVWGNSYYPITIQFENDTLVTGLTGDYIEFPMEPNTSREWCWKIDPAIIGLPKTGGNHKIYAYFFDKTDSVQIKAPKYFGGVASVTLELDHSEEEVQKLRDSINAKVLSSKTFNNLGWISEKWQIEGYQIDSLSNALKNDDRIKNFSVIRWIEPYKIDYTCVADETNKPLTFKLKQNYPNPFNPNTVITYFIPERTLVKVEVFNILGRSIKTLVNENQSGGEYKIKFNASNLPSGVYIYSISANSYFASKKMLLLK